MCFGVVCFGAFRFVLYDLCVLFCLIVVRCCFWSFNVDVFLYVCLFVFVFGLFCFVGMYLTCYACLFVLCVCFVLVLFI